MSGSSEEFVASDVSMDAEYGKDEMDVALSKSSFGTLPGVGVAVAVGVGVEVPSVEVGVGVSVCVGVEVGVPVPVGVVVAVPVGVAVSVGRAVDVCVAVGVELGVAVCVCVGVDVAVAAFVDVAVDATVEVCVGVCVAADAGPEPEAAVVEVAVLAGGLVEVATAASCPGCETSGAVSLTVFETTVDMPCATTLPGVEVGVGVADDATPAAADPTP